MVNDVFLERIAHFVYKVHAHIGVVRINLATPLVNGHEHRFDAGGCLSHERCCAGWRDGETSNVSSTELLHVGRELRVGRKESVNERILSLASGIVYLECATLFSHHNRRPISIQRKCPMNAHGKLGGLGSAISQPHGGNHVALGGYSHARSSAHSAFAFNLLPEVELGTLYFLVLRVVLDFVHYEVNFLHLEVNDIVHDTLRERNMPCKLVKIESGLIREWIFDIRE